MLHILCSTHQFQNETELVTGKNFFLTTLGNYEPFKLILGPGRGGTNLTNGT